MDFPHNPEKKSNKRSLYIRTIGVLSCLGIAAAAAFLLPQKQPDEINLYALGSLGEEIGTFVDAELTPPTLPPTTTTTKVTPPSTLPIPEVPPSDPYEKVPDVVIGRIQIPALGIDTDMRVGISLTTINKGPGWWPGTALPGHMGNVVVAGHRTTYSKPFADLDKLVTGDQVIFTTSKGTFTYVVRGVIITPEDAVDIATQDEVHTATLFACHPKGSADQRIVAKLRMINADGSFTDPDEKMPPLEQGTGPGPHTLKMRKPAQLVDGTDTTGPIGNPGLVGES